MKFIVDDNQTLSDALATFRKSFTEGGFLEQSQVSFAVRLLENPEYSTRIFGSELFPGRTTLARHDCLQTIMNAAGDNDGEAFTIGATMASTGELTPFKSFLFLWATNIFTPRQYHFNARARGIFYRTVELCRKLVKEGTLKDMSQFPIEHHLDDQVGSLRKTLGIDVLLRHIDTLYGTKMD